MESLGGNPPEIGFPEFSAVWAYTPISVNSQDLGQIPTEVRNVPQELLD
jgi:hypothetical protein